MKMGAVPPYSYNDIVSQLNAKFKAQFAEKHFILHLFFHMKPIEKTNSNLSGCSYNATCANNRNLRQWRKKRSGCAAPLIPNQATRVATAIATRPKTRTTTNTKQRILFTVKHPRLLSDNHITLSLNKLQSFLLMVRKKLSRSHIFSVSFNFILVFTNFCVYKQKIHIFDTCFF